MNTANSTEQSTDGITFRRTRREDGGRIWEAIGTIGVLERNTLYAYVLMADEFGDASVIAERDGELMGFVIGLCPPRRPDTVFVWQVGVMPAARGAGLGRRLLHQLVDLDGANHVKFLEATVTPGNKASRALFESFARERAAECTVSEGYTSEDFQPQDHEAEDRFRIGPFR